LIVTKVVLTAVIVGAVVGVGMLIHKAVTSRSDDRQIR
jgi:hypothetical protein